MKPLTCTIDIPTPILDTQMDGILQALDAQNRLEQTVCGFDPAAVALRSEWLAALIEVC